MSRIGKLPIPVPGGVQISQENGVLTVTGPKGTLSRKMIPAIEVKLEGSNIICERPSDSKDHRSLHGLVRSLVNNMVIGVTQGYERRMDMTGVGYRAEMTGDNLTLSVGLSHQVVMEPMEGMKFEVGIDSAARMPFIMVRGIDKEIIGQQTAAIRSVRPPEPYKGKGIRYAGEVIRRKAGKAGKAAGKK